MNKYDNYIDGAWVASSNYLPNTNPSNLQDVIGSYAEASVSQAEAAIAAAHRVKDDWALSNIQQRAEILEYIATEILLRKKELAELLAREEGKVFSEALGEVVRAGNIFRFFAGECLRLRGEVLPSVRLGVDIEVLREPLGVVGLITPWNFPIAIPAWKIAPALAYGNTVVFKPAELSVGSAWALTEIISRAGLPPGVFNLLMGSGSVVGEKIVTDERVSAVSFTGSVVTGQAILKKCMSRQAKVQLEMGGKNPQVVLDDADLEQAVELSIQSAYFSTGQRCTAASRIIVTEGIYERFKTAFIKRMQELRVGDALDPDTEIGPVVSQAQLDQNLSYLVLGQKEGAILHGGKQLQRKTEGFYLQPALFTNCDNTMRICREEIFGPIAALIRVKDYEEALSVANDTPFGLAAGIATQSLKYARHFRRHAQAGMVMVNLPTAGVDYHVPFGGSKGSSYGAREQGSYAREFYTTVKTAYIA